MFAMRVLPTRSQTNHSRLLTIEPLETRNLLHSGALQVTSQPTHAGHCTTTATPAAVVTTMPAAPRSSARAAVIVGDDGYENNDSFYAPSNLGTLKAAKTISGLVMNDSADWYKFKMDASGTASDYVKTQFQHAQGDLDLALYNSAGRLLLRSQGVTNSEQISLNNLTAGTYYIRVYGYQGVKNPSYSLSIDPGAAAVATTSSPAPAPAPSPTGAFDIQISFHGLSASLQSIFNQAAQRWEQVITGDLANATYNGVVVDDLLIDAQARSIDGTGGILGQAGPDRFRTGTFLPYHGSMDFDSADLTQMQQNGSLLSVVEHEIGHILGIGTIWEDRGLLSGAGTSNPRFTGQQATTAYNTIFGVHENGVPVENGGGAGTRDSHWRESLLSNELMTGYAGPGTQLPLSRITVASLADLGYQVNMAAADAYVRPSASAVQTSSTSSSTSSLMSGVVALEVSSQRGRQAIDHLFGRWENQVDALLTHWA